jgi:RNA-binding motif X-linked protein 2
VRTVTRVFRVHAEAYVSRYGEVVDVNLPRDKETGKTKGFGFLMYEDQRSTVLAVDNLNGAKVLDRILRVDHVANYKQKRTKNEDGTWEDAEAPSMNAAPLLVRGQSISTVKTASLMLSSVDDVPSEDEGTVSSAPSIDEEDPMRDYLLAKHREEKAKSKGKKKKHADETPEERRARKERKKAKKDTKSKEGKSQHSDDRKHGVTDRSSRRHRSRSRSPRRTKDASPERRRDRSRDRYDESSGIDRSSARDERYR